MSRPRVEWHIVRITRDHPALAEIMNKMEDIGVFALKDDPLTVPTVAAHYTERPDLYHKFVRMQLEVGLIGGQLYGAFSGSEVTPDSLVGLALWYEPDTEFMASDAEHGPWDAYMRDIQPETKQWWDDILLPRVNLLAKESFGDVRKDTMFQLQLLAVHPDFHRQGIGAALCRHVLRKVDAAGVSSCLETNSTDNVKFYGSLGFEVKGSVLMPSRFGDFIMTCMCRPPRYDTPRV
ncbi:hypothetical protein FRC12_016783 [Ceratobasidium sp. 428]|nr:hypothetical protein FRC12_016783 [Ceratobasidium sp. 428]